MTAYYSTLPDGRRVQRLDTLGVPLASLLGREVHHPHMQVGDDRCAWTKDEVIALERTMTRSGNAITDDGDWFPESHDFGVLVSVAPDPDFRDRVRGRFKDPNRLNDPKHRGLSYDLTNLWVVVED